VRWFPLAEAERTVAFANERALVERARELLEAPCAGRSGC